MKWRRSLGPRQYIENRFDFSRFGDEIAKNGYFLQDSIFSESDINKLKLYAGELMADGQFRPALIGNNAKLQKNKKLRGDEIHWIDNWSNPQLTDLYKLYEQIIEVARIQLFLAIKRFESHFSSYCPGSFYARHSDQHIRSRHRIISSVLYLGHWQESYGGELYLYPEKSQEIKINPIQGRLILFRSDLEHEVKITHFNRWSIATWFRDDLI